MNRINLLPAPRARTSGRRWNSLLEVACLLAVLLVTGLGCWYYESMLKTELEAKQVEKQEKKGPGAPEG